MLETDDQETEENRRKVNTQKEQNVGGAPVAHRVEHVPYSLSPEHSNLCLNPARGPLPHVLPSISHTFLYIQFKKAVLA